MTNGGKSEVEAMACRCGVSPEQCLSDDELLTQHTWKAGSFNDEPREGEQDLSMLRGDVSVAECCDYRSSASRVTLAKVAKAGRRLTTAGKIRAAGLAVVHTPGRRVKDGLHVSIVWPPDDPVHIQQTPWPSDVSKNFAACFNDSEGRVEP